MIKKFCLYLGASCLALALFSIGNAPAAARSEGDGAALVADRNDHRERDRALREEHREREKEYREEMRRREQRGDRPDRRPDYREHRGDGRPDHRPDMRDHRGDRPGRPDMRGM